jgi:hypothetical protein
VCIRVGDGQYASHPAGPPNQREVALRSERPARASWHSHRVRRRRRSASPSLVLATLAGSADTPDTRPRAHIWSGDTAGSPAP